MKVTLLQQKQIALLHESDVEKATKQITKKSERQKNDERAIFDQQDVIDNLEVNIYTFANLKEIALMTLQLTAEKTILNRMKEIFDKRYTKVEPLK